ncbi:unnamed protein product [marine sediment metagenome]|uniref:Uncharacterized protein n=1 Tax=marine sediment metagenome TaxID=412755 RepID=X1V1N6_9ZZZZ
MIERLSMEHPEWDIRSRFTGCQSNKGRGCIGCNRECITQKGFWVRPDGNTSPCPQFKKNCVNPKTYKELFDAIQTAYDFHKFVGTKES